MSPNFWCMTGHSPTLDLDEWLAEWGVVDPAEARGGLAAQRSRPGHRREK